MRLLRKKGWQRVKPVPMPLDLCPGRAVWQAFRNCEYIVFLDESFYQFFNFSIPDGNFCHGALGIPEKNYPRLKELMAPSIEEYRRRVRETSGSAPKEVKFTVLRTLPRGFRLSFTRELVKSLVETGGFVAGFYCSTLGIVMERVRTNLIDEADRVPDDSSALYDVARSELLAQFAGVGQSGLLNTLLMKPLAGIWSLLGSYENVFRVRYDPRERSEDRAVSEAMTDYMSRLVNVAELFGDKLRFIGMDVSVPSNDDIGLQLADIVAGEVRDFFRNNHDAITEGASPNLITAKSEESFEIYMPMNGMLFKRGSLSRMSKELARKLVRRNSRNPVSYYYPILAAGMLSLVTDTGQFRDLEISTRSIFDGLD